MPPNLVTPVRNDHGHYDDLVRIPPEHCKDHEVYSLICKTILPRVWPCSERSSASLTPVSGRTTQSGGMDRPARSGAYESSLRDTNSVKSRTRLVLRVSPWVSSQSVP